MNRRRIAAPAALALALFIAQALAVLAEPANAGVLSPRLLRAEQALRGAGSAEAPALPPLTLSAVANRGPDGLLPAAGEEPRLSLLLVTDDAQALRAAGFTIVTESGPVVTAEVPLSRLRELERVPGLRAAELSRPLRRLLDTSLPEISAVAAHGATQPPYPVTGATGRNVVMGVVDTGIDIAHPDFRNDDGSSRVEWIWDQTDLLGPAPGSGYTYGTVWGSAAIDAGTARQRDTYGHGTHVAGIAAGNGRATSGIVPVYSYVGVAPDADLVVVKTDYTEAHVLDAVGWVRQKATAMGRPCVVNLSLGSQFGSHDGTDAFDLAFNSLSGPGRILVAAAGNEADAGLHAEAVVPGNSYLVLQFTIGDYTAKAGNTTVDQQDVLIMEAWYAGNRNLSFQVTSPRGYASNVIGLNQEATKQTNDGTIYVGSWKADQNDDNTCEIDLWDANATYPPYEGTWSVRVNNLASTATPIDFWIPYDALGAAGAGTHWSTYESPAKTVGSPATSDSMIAVAAYVTKTSWPTGTGTTCGYQPAPALGSLASFSSLGPRRDNALKPEIAAPGMAIASSWSSTGDPSFYGNVSCAVTPDGYHVASQGTSLSAPHIAGVAALILEKHPTDARRQVLARLQNSARTDSWTGAVPNFNFGYGKVNALAAIDAPTPVRLLAMQVVWEEGAATLRWILAETEPGARFTVERGAGAETGFHPVSEALSGGTEFLWVDESPDLDEPWYRVLARRTDGSREILGPVRLETPSATPRLWQNSPNPFAASTRLRFLLDRERDVRIEVLDVTGRRVATLVDGPLGEGSHAVDWDGRDAEGRPAAAGIYFCRLTAGDITLARRMVLKR